MIIAKLNLFNQPTKSKLRCEFLNHFISNLNYKFTILSKLKKIDRFAFVVEGIVVKLCDAAVADVSKCYVCCPFGDILMADWNGWQCDSRQGSMVYITHNNTNGHRRIIGCEVQVLGYTV